MPPNKIYKTVLHYGGFKETLDEVVSIMQAEQQCSAVIRGNVGCGKKTLISEAERIAGVECIHVNPYQYPEDDAALKSIAAELGVKKTENITELIKDIRKIAAKKGKVVIVLRDFEQFCRKKQSLLYNLTNLTLTTRLDKEGSHVTLIGLTKALDWAEELEKRVRSRLNAKTFHLTYPYRNLSEYIEFASLLLDKKKITLELREQLEYMYMFNRSVRNLKRYLVSITKLDSKGKLLLNFDPEAYREDYQQLDNNLMRERLRYLTDSQLDLIKIGAHCCWLNEETSFSLLDLIEWGQKSDQSKLISIDLNRPELLRDVALLLRLRLLKPTKIEDVTISEDIKYYLGATLKQLKAIIAGDEKLQKHQNDNLWKKLA